MKIKRLVGFLGTGMLLLGAVLRAEVSLEDFWGMSNPVFLEADIVGGGPPPEEVLKRAREKGFKSVIDLRRPEEGTETEKEMVQGLGMSYHSVMVTPRTLNRWQVDDLAEILKDPANRPAILHCGSGNRVGSLWALYLYFERGIDAEAALKTGIKKGLRGQTLIRITRALMGNQGKPVKETVADRSEIP